MTKTTSWIVAISATVVAVAVGFVVVAILTVADAYGQVVNDRACVAALEGVRAERTAGTTGPELATLQVVAERYCSEVESDQE